MRTKNAAQTNSNKAADTTGALQLPGQKVLVLQGGGALGAYQIGVYQALHEAGIEPDWVIGTSIGAINGALIAGNKPENRIARLEEFWARMAHRTTAYDNLLDDGLRQWLATMSIVSKGIPAFFTPNHAAWLGQKMSLGAEKAAYYSTAALKKTLTELVDFGYIGTADNRLTVGAVNARTGVMTYFDSRSEPLHAEHVMASGALPPAFPAVRINGEPYWDGGLYSNTPIEAVLDDRPRLDSIIFSVQLWNPHGTEPNSLWDIQNRIKDIQFASRAKSHIERQRQLHRLRHIVRELQAYIPESERNRPEVKELAAWGCGTTMHIVKLNAPALAGEDQYKDIDFTERGIAARRATGFAETMRALEAKPWTQPVDPIEGVLVYEVESGLVHQG